jgi:uncharacterized protein YndB with AHSA1/START domain
MANATPTPASDAVAVELRRIFAASRQRVFAAWTSAEALKRWHAPENAVVEDATVDFRVGGRYEVGIRSDDGVLHRVGGHYREIDPPKRIVLTWQWVNAPDAPQSLVTVEFIEHGANTEVVLVHEGLATDKEREGHRHGWVGCLAKLEQAI